MNSPIANEEPSAIIPQPQPIGEENFEPGAMAFYDCLPSNEPTEQNPNLKKSVIYP